jgi:CubicO group peptidase (beta-lactamase class C family)
MKVQVLIILWIMFSQNILAQPSNIVKPNDIVNEMHKSHVGKIIFTDRLIPLDSLQKNDFITSTVLNRNSNLAFRVFMNNSITNYMHVLAPKLTLEELMVSGNFQFSFFVDNKFIYKENMHHGCGLNKNVNTTFTVPFISRKSVDYWSIYLWDRFKSNGGESTLAKGNHILKVEMRPYVKLNENAVPLVGDIIASGQLTLNIKKEKISKKERAIQKIAYSEDWKISKSKFDNKKIETLNKAIIDNTFKAITSIVIIKENELLIEEYFNTASRNTLHDTRSVGKTFTSALMGIAIKEGYIKNEAQTLGDFYKLKTFSNYDPQKESISIKDLLTMSSAIDGSDQIDTSPGNEENMYPSENWVKFALDVPMDKNKSNGKQWDYFTAGVVLLGDILNKSVPNQLEKYAEEKLFAPLNIKNYEWQYTPQNVVNTAGGLQMSALDFAKFGELYRNKGNYKGKQILTEEWVIKSFTKHHAIPERNDEYYGFLFWNKTYHVNGKDYETYYCAGNGGSKIFIFKDIPYTIVITAKAYSRPYGHSQVDKMMEEYILPALLKE